VRPDAETERLYREIRNDALPTPMVADDAGYSGQASVPNQLSPDAPAGARLPIAVLPFANMSGYPAQDYFSSGITEEIVTELTRFRFLFVVAGLDSTPDVWEACRRLGVKYVIEGQVRPASDRVRVTVQLIDTPSGCHLWAERFDGTFDDIFLDQDE